MWEQLEQKINTFEETLDKFEQNVIKVMNDFEKKMKLMFTIWGLIVTACVVSVTVIVLMVLK